MVFHLDAQVGFDASHRGQDVIQNLLGRHPKRPSARADLQPAFFVAIIALGEVLGADQDDITVIGQFHKTWPGNNGWRKRIRRVRRQWLGSAAISQRHQQNGNPQRDAIPAEAGERVRLHEAQQPLYRDERHDRGDHRAEQDETPVLVAERWRLDRYLTDVLPKGWLIGGELMV